MHYGSIISINQSHFGKGRVVDWNLAGLNGILAFSVDVNGYKGPNQLGRDLFYFILSSSNFGQCYNYGICKPDKIIPMPSTCNKDSAGWGCAKRIIDNNWKMDY